MGKRIRLVANRKNKIFWSNGQGDEFAGVTGGYWFVVLDSGQVVSSTGFISGEQLSFNEIKTQLNQQKNILKFSGVSHGDLGVKFTFLGFLLNFHVNQEKVKSAVKRISGMLRDMGIAPNLSCSGCAAVGNLECYKVGTYGARLLCPECLDKLKKFIDGGLHGYNRNVRVVKGYAPE